MKAATWLMEQEYAASQISIHAAREGGDGLPANRALRDSNFNPRRP